MPDFETKNQNLQQNLSRAQNPDQPAKPTSKGNYLIWVFILAVIVVAAAIIYLIHIHKPKVNPSPTVSAPAQSSSYVPTLSDTQNMLQQKSKISFPNISARVAAKVSALPQDLQTALNSNLSAATVQKLTYSNGKTGFDVQYSVAGTLEATYMQLLGELSAWKLLYAARANLAAIYDGQNSAYQLHATLTSVGPSATKVEIQTISQ